jgi:hypothetical protein
MADLQTLTKKAKKLLSTSPYKFEGLHKANDSTHKWTIVISLKGYLHAISFGHVDYEDFTQHKDRARRANYLARATKIRDKDGRYTYKNPLSPNFYSVNLLW